MVKAPTSCADFDGFDDLPCHAVVFGRVEEGMQVVKAIEAVGTSSGKPRKRVTVVDCGELPSKRMILKRIQAEKEELANLKKDPIAVSIFPFYP